MPVSIFPIETSDHIGRPIKIFEPPRRIVSLVPSITELLIDLGLEEQTVGRTKFCIYPEHVKKIPQIGGTKTPHIEKIISLKPDLIIASKEENKEEDILMLEKVAPVFVSSIQTIHSAIQLIEDISTLCNASQQGQEMVKEIEDRRQEWHKQSFEPINCMYLIWKEPYMTIGKDTFIFHMLEEAGFHSVVFDFRYPTTTLEEMKASEATQILLSSEPFPFQEKHKLDIQKDTDKEVILVDGTYFSWYGSRLLKAYDYFEKLRESLL